MIKMKLINKENEGMMYYIDESGYEVYDLEGNAIEQHIKDKNKEEEFYHTGDYQKDIIDRDVVGKGYTIDMIVIRD